jgi:hypothetical protein
VVWRGGVRYCDVGSIVVEFGEKECEQQQGKRKERDPLARARACVCVCASITSCSLTIVGWLSSLSNEISLHNVAVRSTGASD